MTETTCLTKFVDFCGLPARLAQGVIDQLGGWHYFRAQASDVSNHGADCGFSGFCYYAETVPFAEQHLSDLLSVCRDMADAIGADGAYSLIAGFACLDMTTDQVVDAIHATKSEPEGPLDDRDLVLNALAWFALEEVARAYADADDD